MIKLRKLLPAIIPLALACGTTLPANAQDATIALETNVNTFDPHMTATVGTDLSVISHIYPALVLRGPDRDIQPSLATSWEAVDDNTWRFTLREGATFTNGEPINAETVKWNIERVLDEENGARIRSWFTRIDEVEVISDTELEIRTSEPYPALVDQLSMFFMLPPEWAADHDPATETMSGGRYVVDENRSGELIRLSRNPDFWGEAAPFETITFRTIPESSSRIAALQADEVDLIVDIPATEIERVDGSDNASADAVPSIRSVFIKFNTLEAPLDNPVFRRALNYAVDKEAITEAIFGGRAEVSQCQVLTEDYFGYNPDLEPYPYDPERARELLDESGVDLSQTIPLEIPSGAYLQGSEVAQVVASQLGAVGVNVELSEIEFGAYLEKYVQSSNLAPMSLLGQAWPTIDADGLLGLFEPGTAYAYWQNEEFHEAFRTGGSTTDEKARLEAYRRATEVMCDQAPVIFLYAQPATYGVSDDVVWQARGDDWLRGWDLSPAE